MDKVLCELDYFNFHTVLTTLFTLAVTSWQIYYYYLYDLDRFLQAHEGR